MAKFMNCVTASKKTTTSANHKISPQDKKRQVSAKLTIFEMTLFAMFAAMMFISKIVMEFLPNIHLLGMFTMLLTVVYRKKALIPIYLYVLINGIYAGFAMWWVPYTYVWAVLWVVTMLMPTEMSKGKCMIIYPTVCALHGLLFGVLYAPAQALMFSFSFDQTITWIISGLAMDVVHCAGNFVAGMLIYPLSVMLKKLNRKVDKI